MVEFSRRDVLRLLVPNFKEIGERSGVAGLSIVGEGVRIIDGDRVNLQVNDKILYQALLRVGDLDAGKSGEDKIKAWFLDGGQLTLELLKEKLKFGNALGDAGREVWQTEKELRLRLPEDTINALYKKEKISGFDPHMVVAHELFHIWQFIRDGEAGVFENQRMLDLGAGAYVLSLVALPFIALPLANRLIKEQNARMKFMKIIATLSVGGGAIVLVGQDVLRANVLTPHKEIDDKLPEFLKDAHLRHSLLSVFEFTKVS